MPPDNGRKKSAFNIKFHTREHGANGGESGSKKGKKQKGGGSKLSQQMEQTEVFLHPTSVNGKVSTMHMTWRLSAS